MALNFGSKVFYYDPFFEWSQFTDSCCCDFASFWNCLRNK